MTLIPHQPPIRLVPQHIDKGWGGETIICNNEEYCGKVLHFHKGARFSSHFHVSKRETFWLQRGQLSLTTIDTRDASQFTQVLNEGDIVEIPRLCIHQITALEDSDMVEFSTHDDPADSLRVFPGDSQRNLELKDQYTE